MDYHASVVTHPEPDILECEVKWALGSTVANEVSGGDGIPAELFKNAKKIMLLKCCTQYVTNLGNPAVATGLEKVNPHPSSQEGQY